MKIIKVQILGLREGGTYSLTENTTIDQYDEKGSLAPVPFIRVTNRLSGYMVEVAKAECVVTYSDKEDHQDERGVF